MTRYILRRLVQAVPVLFGITLFTFLMVHLTPGDPVLIFAEGKPLSEEREAQIREQYGLDRPLWDAISRLHGGSAAWGSGAGAARSAAGLGHDPGGDLANPTTHRCWAHRRDHAGRDARDPRGAVPQLVARFGGDGRGAAGCLDAGVLPGIAAALRLFLSIPSLSRRRGLEDGRTWSFPRSPLASPLQPTSPASCARRCWRCCGKTT